MNKIKVLLVEDETSLAMILSDTLEAQGFEMRRASRCARRMMAKRGFVCLQNRSLMCWLRM